MIKMFGQCIFYLFILGSITASQSIISSRTFGSCTMLTLEHGRVRPRGRLVKFACNSRYTLIGNRYATCRNGRWDVPVPICIRSGCTQIKDIDNGLQIASNNYAWIIFFCLPGFKLKGSQTVYCDGIRWNATAPTCINSTASVPLSCDFEKPDLCGWTNSDLHDFDWERLNKKTPSSFLNTGPSYDHTYGKGGSGYYMYIETTSRYENDTARLLSPIYDSSLLTDACFSFFYHMYGNGTGGLRVYLKPDYVSLPQLTSQSEQQRNYILFEKWGNLGDFWYSSVTPLKNVSDNFQIVIEGIRGKSFTSDIAIDDVAILQGSNCTAAKMAATTPTTTVLLSDSCENRCFKNETTVGCKCSMTCFLEDSCCIDFFDICIFQGDFTLSYDGIDLAPQTQKLIASSTELTETTSTSTTIKTTNTTPNPVSTTTTTTTMTTTSTTTTTPRPTTTKTTPSITTKRTPTAATKYTTTTSKPNTARAIKKDKPVLMTTRKVTKAPATNRTTTRVTIKSTTNMPFGISRTIENHNDFHNMIDKARKEQEVETRKVMHMQFEGSKPSSSSGWKIMLIIFGVVACIGTASWIILIARSSRGRETIARLRGHINHDPEVRFLTSDVDDD